MQDIPKDLRERINRKRLIFTVTTGRSGTKYLAGLLGLIDGITAHHEPWPEFVEVMREAQSDPGVAREFLRLKKLEAIAAEDDPIYVETSHLFCKGFLEPLISLGVVPDLVLLKRPHRQVALSMLRLGTIPGSSEWYLSPNDPVVLALPDWESLHEYQLCYWYCLEIDRRARAYSKQLREHNAVVVSTSLDAIGTVRGFNKLLSDLGLPKMSPHDRSEFLRIAHRPVNRKPRHAPRKPLPADAELDALETEVLSRVKSGSMNPAHWKGSLRSTGEQGPRWIDGTKAIRRITDNLLKDARQIILLDDGKLPTYVSARSGILPLMERNGVFWGRPASSEDAIRGLERLRREGAKFLVVARTAFWWLSEYPAFHRHLTSNYHCVEEGEFAVVFALEKSAQGEAHHPIAGPPKISST